MLDSNEFHIELHLFFLKRMETLFCVWERQDSNLRRKSTDLQSAAFNHSATFPKEILIIYFFFFLEFSGSVRELSLEIGKLRKEFFQQNVWMLVLQNFNEILELVHLQLHDMLCFLHFFI